MAAPLTVTPPELMRFAQRTDGYAETAGEGNPEGALFGASRAVPGGEVASITVALGQRLGRSAADISDMLTAIADMTRSATDVITQTDLDNAATLGVR